MSDNRPIGVFDSGMGGLTVLAELVRALPHERFVYLGDTARVPYGPRSPRVVRKYSLEAADFLLKKDIKFFVIACNTATAHAEIELSEKLGVPVLGVIAPGVQAMLSRTKTRRVGVIGTRSMIKSGAYDRAIQERDESLGIFSRACPLFVPLVEEGWHDKKLTAMVIQEYLSEMVREDVDTIVLGCTHYPLLKGAIQSEFPELILIDSSVETARAVDAKLNELNLRAEAASGGASGTSEGDARARILLTDVTDQMERLEQLFYGLPFSSVEEVRLGESAH